MADCHAPGARTISVIQYENACAKYWLLCGAIVEELSVQARVMTDLPKPANAATNEDDAARTGQALDLLKHWSYCIVQFDDN